MGVMGCFRSGCERIMCYRYSHDYGYICDDCFDELVSLGINADIRQFMDSDKIPQKPDLSKMTYEYFDSIFSIRN